MNTMAIEQSLNEFQQEVFMAEPQYNLLVQNFEKILLQTELKKNEDLDLSFLDDILRDIVHFYATFYTSGDKRKAKLILENQAGIHPGELAKTCFCLGGCVFVSILLIIQAIFNPVSNYALYMDQLFQTTCAVRVMQNFVMIAFGAGICLKVWK